MDNLVRRLEGGLATLSKAQQDTKELSEVLAEKNIVIGENTIVVNEIIADITEKS